MKGPFLIDRGTLIASLAFALAQNHVVSPLVMPGFMALGWNAPGTDRMAPTG